MIWLSVQGYDARRLMSQNMLWRAIGTGGLISKVGHRAEWECQIEKCGSFGEISPRTIQARVCSKCNHPIGLWQDIIMAFPKGFMALASPIILGFRWRPAWQKCDQWTRSCDGSEPGLEWQQGSVWQLCHLSFPGRVGCLVAGWYGRLLPSHVCHSHVLDRSWVQWC